MNTQFTTDETFEYIPTVGDISLDPIMVSWNLIDDDIDITHIEFDDNVWTGAELWELDDNLAENIMEYIDNEFVSNNDFWFDKSNPEL
tara:strand:- start:699 stop:962 length:264 start_codon:yes stop_codon:yes gene_type:complete